MQPIDLIYRAADHHPDATAVVTPGGTIGYRELKARVNALAAHPAIHDCVVFGRPDEKWGEAVQVAVELREHAVASADEIIAFAKQQVGSVQAPKRVHFLDSLPRSAVGKVQRREVRAVTETEEGG